MKPLVSVCIPTYNGGKYLKESLDSVLSQTFIDFEILIVDDCSSDDTVDISQAYSKKDSRIKITVNEKNLGLVKNWNRCIELAQGEWIKFVFQDDTLQPNCLEKMLAARQPDSLIVACNRNFIFDNKTPKSTQKYYQTLPCLANVFPNKVEILAQEYCEALLKYIPRDFSGEINLIGEPTSVLLHKSVFYKYGTFNSNLIQICDFEFWTRIITNNNIIYLQESLATFRVHHQSASANNTAKSKYRRYRAFVLDSLILLHDYVYNPVYENLRTIAEKHKPSINLEKLLKHKIYTSLAMAMTERTSEDRENPELDCVSEWKKIAKLYPIIKLIAQNNKIKVYIIYAKLTFKSYKKIIKNKLVNNQSKV